MFKASMGYIAQETKQNTKYPTVKETVWLEAVSTGDPSYFRIFHSPLHYLANTSHFRQRKSVTQEDEPNTQVCYPLEFP